VDELIAHHEQRFTEVIAAIRSGIDTPWGIASQMRWSRPWNRIEGFMRRAAGRRGLRPPPRPETRGVLRMIEGEPVRWELVSSD